VTQFMTSDMVSQGAHADTLPMGDAGPHERCLRRPEALEAILPLVYDELRRLARSNLRQQRPNLNSLQIKT
jgi:hypothetical protein